MQTHFRFKAIAVVLTLTATASAQLPLSRAPGLKMLSTPKHSLLAPADELPELLGCPVTGSGNTYTGKDLYYISSATPSLMLSGINSSMGGVSINGKYYATNLMDYGFAAFVATTVYDLNTGSSIASMSSMVRSDAGPGGLALDPTDGTVYGITYGATADDRQLSSITYDITTTPAKRTVTKIAALEGSNWQSLTCDAQGQLYAINSDSEASSLYKIDKSTGAATLVGSTGRLAQKATSAIIDRKSGRMYWNAVSAEGVSELCEVDLATGAATTVLTYTTGQCFAGICVAAEPEGASPGPALNLKASFPRGGLDGTIEFDAPTVNFDDTPATGALTYEIAEGSTVIASGDTECGAHVSANVTVTQTGMHEFTVTVINTVGRGPKAKCKVFVGNGTPSAPAPVLALGADSKLQLSWDAVTTSADGGFIDPNQITYNVVRMPGDAVVATGITETSFSEDIPAGMEGTPLYYSVYAAFDGRVSEAGRSNIYGVGAINPPYHNTFSAESDLDGFTFANVNDDESEWKLVDGEMKIDFNRDLDMDDWFVTPGVWLEAGRAYYVSFKARSGGENFLERVEARWGSSADVEALVNTIVEPTTVNMRYGTILGNYIVPEADGIYYVGIHGISPKDVYFLAVDDLKISAPQSTAIPAAPVINATADGDGALKAAISVTTPTVDLVGNPLSALTAIEIFRDDELIETIANPEPGQTYDYTDSTLSAGGSHVYKARCLNEAGNGPEVRTTLFVGVPMPAAAKNLTIAETANEGEVTLTWDPVTTDIDGNPLDPSHVTYEVIRVIGFDVIPIASGLTTTTYTTQAVKPGERAFVLYGVYAVTNGGKAVSGTQMMPVGKPYDGLKEGFPAGIATAIWTQANASAAEWMMVNESQISGITAHDGDHGYALMEGRANGASASLVSGKIAVPEADDAALSLWTYNLIDQANGLVDENMLNIYVREVGQTYDWTPIYSTAIKDLSSRYGWVRAAVSLKDYAGKTVQLRIESVASTFTYTMVDDITVGRIAALDLHAAALTAPRMLRAGNDYTVDVNVINEGLNEARNFTVTLYADGQKADSQSFNALAPGDEMIASFKRNMSAVATEPVTYYATVSLDGDANSDNDTTVSQTVEPRHSNYPAPTGLTGVLTESGADLSWNAPEPSFGGTTEESFEDGESFAQTYEGWTFIDRDASPVGGFSGVTLPGIVSGQTPVSFFVFDTDHAGLSAYFSANSGSKFLASLYRADNGAVDDWAISPELSGEAQTISFYARSYHPQYLENIEILYSTGSLNPEDFIAVKAVPELAGTWTLIEADLPEGAKYFAIHNLGSDNFMLMLDDFTFNASDGGTSLNLLGYDIYRGGIRINATPVTGTAYNDPDASEGDSYMVVAVYDRGASAPSNEVILKPISLESLTAAIPRVWAEKGRIRISGAGGHSVSIVDQRGRIHYNGTATADMTIDVDADIYLIVIDGKTTKLIVR